MNRNLNLVVVSLLIGLSVVLNILFIQIRPTDLSVSAQTESGAISGAIYNEDGSSLIPNVMYGIASTESSTYFTTWCSGDGQFSQQVDFGTYKVFAQGDSADCGGDPNYAREYWQEKDNWAAAGVITINADSPNATGITFTLKAGSSISGYVYEADGVTPISGASLWASIQDGYYIYGTHSESDGSYILGGLSSNTYKLRATANDLQPEWYLEKDREGDADPIVITSSGMISDINFTLEPGGSISGRVYQADGVTPIPNAWVYAMDMQFQFITGANSQTNGSYLIGGLTQGSYYLAVQANGFGGVYYPNGYDDPHAVSVIVIPPDTTQNINFTLSPEATASGFVYQSDGVTPISNAYITIWPQHGGQVRGAYSSANGSYTAHGLSTGSYVAKAEAAGLVWEFYLNATSWGSATPFSVVQPQNTDGITFTLSTITETVEVDPTSGGSLVYTDTTGSQTSILVPPGAVTATITLEYKSTSASSTPPNLAFAGKSFELNAFQGAQQLENFIFQIPVTTTIEYTDQDVLNLNENDLILYYWDELVSEWVDVAASCTPSSNYIRHPDENWLAVPICHLSQFSLFGKSQFKIFLPVVIR